LSAIWGIIDFSKKIVLDKEAIIMEEPYKKYKIDTYNTYKRAELCVGYGGQYFTKEARFETMPYHTDNIIFAADVVLDNRRELLNKLGIKKSVHQEYTDGQIMYHMIREYGIESFPMFLGTYSFFYYDMNKGEAYLAADSVASRSIYYHYDKGVLYFSTLIDPIIQVLERKVEWNRRWINDYLALNELAMYTECEETPYKNILKISPGKVLVLTKNMCEKITYYSPFSYIQYKKIDKEYKEEFIELFQSCVEDTLRSKKNTSILLSGGLDSSSVAAFAAPYLEKTNDTLYSFTSIPEYQHESSEEQYYIENERASVEQTAKIFENIEPHFIECNDMNGWDLAEEIMIYFELPYKALQNVVWMLEAMKQARDKNCLIMLTGQYGNTTISFGNFEIYFTTLLKKGKIIKLYKQVNAFNTIYHKGRRFVYQDILNGVKQKNVQLTKEEMFSKVYVNKKLADRYNTEERFKNNGYNMNLNMKITLDEYRPYMYSENALVQIGEIETKMSLMTGVLLRDPTRDRRIIEFCLRIPENQYVHNGVSRRLVREYLKGYVPDHIRNDWAHKGRQSADMVDRINKNWSTIYPQCVTISESKIAEYLLETDMIKKQLHDYKDGFPNGSDFEVMKLLYSLLLVKYVEMVEGRNKCNNIVRKVENNLDM
jgi:asparagine synthase (glutamine-hydrolysing)